MAQYGLWQKRKVYSMDTCISAIRIARQPSKLKVVGSNPTGPAKTIFGSFISQLFFGPHISSVDHADTRTIRILK